MSLPHLQLLSRSHCCLCDDAKPLLLEAASQGLCTWEVVDVDQDKALLVRYGLDVPVLLLNGEELCRHRVTHATLMQALRDVEAAA